MNCPELLIAPAQRTPWGIITPLRGPLPAVTQLPVSPKLRRVNACLHGAMVTLSRMGPRYSRHRLVMVFCRLHQALADLLKDGSAPPWRVAYCFDRLGLVAQLLGCHDLAESWYLRSLALMDLAGWRPTPWNELTCLNLAILYNAQGRGDLAASLVARSEDMRRRGVESMGRTRRVAHMSRHDTQLSLYGRTPVRELDLHGVKSDQAERMVRAFLMTGARSGSGQVLRIITGKGNRSSGTPVLLPLVRRMLETSLAQFVAEFRLDLDGGSYLIRVR